MNTTPPPMPDPLAWHEYARKKPTLKRLVFDRTSRKDLRVAGWVSEALIAAAAVEARDAQWMERITALEAENATLSNALHAIDTVAVFLPTFEVKHEGGPDAAAQNIVDAISSVLATTAALEADRKILREALKALLDDTQHAEHPDCEDGPCPVREARAALERTQ